jgi:cell wall-associated NlpC family hydrolase
MIFRFNIFTILISALLLLASCQSTAKFATKIRNQRTAYNPATGTSHFSSLDEFVQSWLGTPYRYGGNTQRGVDCSGFVFQAYQQVFNKKIPRSARSQYMSGNKIQDHRRQPGDLLFFRGISGPGIDHVGIYLGDGRFAHASLSGGVIISEISDEYYSERYVGTCRY